jgi:nitrilase
MNSKPDRSFNLAEAERLMREAMLCDRPDLIVLPEHFDWTGGTIDEKRGAADFVPEGDAYRCVQRFAADNCVAVHAGSLLERRRDADRIFNTTVVFDATGIQIGTYRKVHLFDITAPDGKRYAESETVAPGDELLIYELHGYRIACSICYDLRFSRLFDRLAADQVDIFVLPAAFTRQTGRDHWEVLCRARAIEFQTYILACGQCGSYQAPGGETRHMFGHSMICDPWGTIVASGSDDVGIVSTTIDRRRIDQVRGWIPMSDHRVDLSTMEVRFVASSTPTATIHPTDQYARVPND